MDQRLLMALETLLIPAVAFAVVTAMVVPFAVRVARTRKRGDVARWARERGLAYVEREVAPARRLSAPPFGTAEGAEAREIVSGSIDGAGFLAFRLVLMERIGSPRVPEIRDVASYQVAWLELHRELPLLTFEAERRALRSIGEDGVRDVDTESHAFNQRWRVGAHDEAYAHAVLAPRVIEELLHPGWEGGAVIIEAGVIALVHPGATDVVRLDARLTRLRALVDAIPPFVMADHGR